MPDANFGSLERRRPSSADRQVAASETVARMASAMYEEERALYYERQHQRVRRRALRPDWQNARPERREFFLAYARRLIEKGIVLPPPPPYEGPAPMPGQQRIDA